ncbi:rRNA processing/ribosome biogenesis-domain-containing protein [Nemania serpens]|nr:rRNA processing/ribosome biogenesis-domain-containing protein [Nemania serpens]
MALVSLPPELQSICRRLTSTKVEQLPTLLPTLLKDVARCQEPLSRPLEPKASESSPEAAKLVHQLKTQITTLLNGRTSQGRFVGAALAKSVVESGGWECLRASDLWVRSLISIIKKDPAITKDLCIVTLAKIYTLMHEYPTLVREIVTPTLPDFANACLQILKPPVSSRVGKAPYGLVETIFEAMSTLVPLHPTTLRQFVGKLKAEIRPFLVPTMSDNVLIPITLQTSSRRLVIRLHMTAAKGGDSTEWTRNVEELIKTLNSTADQVFRAVQEAWESTVGYKPQSVNIDVESQGGGESLEQLPRWAGVQAGGERIIGLLDFIGEYLHCRTRVAVTIPITALVDITSRISSIKPPSSNKEKYDTGMNPAIGREERDELWTVFPDIQVASMRVHLALIERLERSYIPLAQESLDQTLRIIRSTYRLPQARTTAFKLVKKILYLCGPTLPKFTVESLGLLVKCCCRDLLGAAGCLPKPKLQSSSATHNGQKPKTVSQNADAFLPSKSQDDVVSVSLSSEHLGAAEALLPILFSHLPQQHIPSSLRSQMLKTAILSRNRDAQVASILRPARDRSGRIPQVILPYLTQQFPQDQSVEILRFNFRPMATGPSGEFLETDDAMDVEVDEEAQPESKMNGFSFEQGFNTQFSSAFVTAASTAQFTTSSPAPTRSAGPLQTPFLAPPSGTTVQSESGTTNVDPPSASTGSLKRKNEDAAAETSLSKRVEIDTAKSSVPSTGPVISSRSDIPTTAATFTASNNTAPVATAPAAVERRGQGGEDESSDDDESVHLNMELDSEDDDEDEDGDDD